MVTLGDLARKGKENYRRKISVMRTEYEAAKDRAIAGYDATPFGPSRKAAYKSAWEVMPDHYKDKVVEGLEEKWSRNWAAKMAR